MITELYRTSISSDGIAPVCKLPYICFISIERTPLWTVSWFLLLSVSVWLRSYLSGNQELDIEYKAIKFPVVKFIISKAEGNNAGTIQFPCASIHDEEAVIGEPVYEGLLRLSQLMGHQARSYWIPLTHLERTGKYPKSSVQKASLTDVPSTMELFNEPALNVRAGLYFKKATKYF